MALVDSCNYLWFRVGVTGSNPVPPTNLNLISPDSYLPENLKIYGSSRAVGERPEHKCSRSIPKFGSDLTFTLGAAWQCWVGRAIELG